MAECKICGNCFDSNNKLSAHVRLTHKIPRKNYYDLYIKIDGEGNCVECGKETTFRGNKYLVFCSHECYNKSDITSHQRSVFNKGKKQNKETIEKRIANTDQNKKEETRQKTLKERYKDEMPFKRKSFGPRKSPPPRTKEHSKKIAESRKNNKTNIHTEITKLKIKKTIRELYDSDDAPITIGKYNSYVCGYYGEFYYRSSYELTFLKYCDKNNIKVVSAETKEFRVRYFDDNGISRFYYPDFYLPKYDVVVEIKPLSMLNYGNNIIKSHEASLIYSYIIITEEELLDLDEVFKYL
jgi:hypothetical protein